MSTATALTAVRGILDYIAKGRENSLANYTGGTDLWARVDAAADETFENRVKGSSMTAADTALENGAVWNASPLATVFTELNGYFTLDLAITGSPYLSGYLASYGGFRVPYHAAEALADALGSSSRLPTYRVFPKGTRPANEATAATSGMQKLGRYAATDTWTPDTPALDTTRMVGAAIVGINQSAAQSAACTLTCTLQDGTTKDIAASWSTAAQYTQAVFGSQAISSGAAAGQKVVSVAATAQFKVGEYILIYESDTLQEVAKIASIQTNTSVTVDTNLLNSFTTGGFVYPMFTSAVYKTGTGTGSGNVDVYYFPDRIIAL